MVNQSVASLAEYKFNIRSFHPEKTFGWSGMMFDGDSRGFSLQPSGTGATKKSITKVSLHHVMSCASLITPTVVSL